MSLPIPASLTTILPAVTSQLMTVTGFPTERVLIAKTPKLFPVFQGDQDIVLIPGPLSREELTRGAGRSCVLGRRTLTIAIRTRLGLDESNRSDTWVLDTNLGHYIREEQVIDALDIFQPTDSNQNVLTQEPITWDGTSIVIETDNKQWGGTQMGFNLLYQIPLTGAVSQ